MVTDDGEDDFVGPELDLVLVERKCQACWRVFQRLVLRGSERWARLCSTCRRKPPDELDERRYRLRTD